MNGIASQQPMYGGAAQMDPTLVRQFVRQALSEAALKRGAADAATGIPDLVTMGAGLIRLAGPDFRGTRKQRFDDTNWTPVNDMVQQKLTDAGVPQTEGAGGVVGRVLTSMLAPASLVRGAGIVGKAAKTLDNAAMGDLPRMAGGTERGSVNVFATTPLKGADFPEMVSVARPTVPGRSLYGDPNTEMLLQNTDRLMMLPPETLDKTAALLKSLPMMTYSNAKGATDVINDFVKRGADNLEFIATKLTPADEAEMSRKWYATANRLSGESARKAGLPEPVGHAITANYSPGTDWNINIARQQRLLNMIGNDFDLSAPSDFKAAQAFAKEKLSDEKSSFFKNWTPKQVNEILRSPLLDIQDPRQQVFKVMATDAAQNPRFVPQYNPQGEIIDPLYSRITWGSGGDFKKIANILKNPTREGIAENLGGLSKVPSFYNNIAAPQSRLPIVTNDTHNMSAVNLTPFGQKDLEVAQGFGAAPTGGGATQGITGLYPVYNDSVVEAARRLNMPPMQTQSVTWETMRKMTEGIKSQKLKDAVTEIWRQEKNPAEAQRKIVELMQAARKAQEK